MKRVARKMRRKNLDRQNARSHSKVLGDLTRLMRMARDNYMPIEDDK